MKNRPTKLTLGKRPQLNNQPKSLKPLSEAKNQFQ
jgi:hypothetical protein